ncbi:SixA phosphatase family protein [Microbulbifer sp. M83]|uniref:SixA phosphatase family protein n=1 Tax=Microbulbifer sp. M83 TaxID=3118246 RepID=UPI002FE12D0C
MKKLTLIRHAKSSWDDPSLNDFDRPLNKRGERDLPAMAKRVRDFGLVPDYLLTSGAVRALTTARAVADALQLEPGQVKVEPELYACSSRELLQQLQRQSDRWRHLMVVGHNPGLENLACYLTDERLAKFPTAAVLHLHLHITRWTDLAESCGSVELFDYPKLHR